MTLFLPRHRWLPAAGVAACLALSAACSGSSSGSERASSPAPSSPSRSSSAAPSAAVDASPALRRVAGRAKALRSYRFAATQTLTGGPTPQVTRLSGRAIRPASIALTITTGGKTQQLVRLGAVGYRRVPPAPYKRLVKPSTLKDPLGSVISVMSRLVSVTSTPLATGTAFSAVLSGPDAVAAGLVTNATPAPGLTLPVRITTDRFGQLIRFELTAPLRSGTRSLMLRQVTTYAGFNAQAPIPRPR